MACGGPASDAQDTGAAGAGAGPGAADTGAMGAPGAAASAAGPMGLLEVGEESMAGGMEVRPASVEGTSRLADPTMAAICVGVNERKRASMSGRE